MTFNEGYIVRLFFSFRWTHQPPKNWTRTNTKIVSPMPWCGFVKLLFGPTAKNGSTNTTVVSSNVKICSHMCILCPLRKFLLWKRRVRMAVGTMKRKTIAAMTPWARMRLWYWGCSRKRFPIPITISRSCLIRNWMCRTIVSHCSEIEPY